MVTIPPVQTANTVQAQRWDNTISDYQTSLPQAQYKLKFLQQKIHYGKIPRAFVLDLLLLQEERAPIRLDLLDLQVEFLGITPLIQCHNLNLLLEQVGRLLQNLNRHLYRHHKVQTRVL